jgi:hypothetical protein
MPNIILYVQKDHKLYIASFYIKLADCDKSRGSLEYDKKEWDSLITAVLKCVKFRSEMPK